MREIDHAAMIARVRPSGGIRIDPRQAKMRTRENGGLVWSSFPDAHMPPEPPEYSPPELPPPPLSLVPTMSNLPCVVSHSSHSRQTCHIVNLLFSSPACFAHLNNATERSMMIPHQLSEGSKVALVAPAGVVRRAEDVAQAEENVRSLGWIPVTAANCLACHAFFAGTDAERASDLNDALGDPDIDAVWCIRGGYGAMRILDDVNYDSISSNPKPLIGFSDITALHSAIARNCGIVTYHGPTARGELTAFSRESLVKAVVTRENPCGHAPAARVVLGGRATGRLSGGNLAIIAALVGTPYAADLADSILILEDVNEPMYRVDRMMQQLLLSGSLDGCAAIAFGDCAPPAGDDDDSGRTLEDVLGEIATRLDIPCITNIPVGHIDEQWTIPLGATATLDADARTLNVHTN